MCRGLFCVTVCAVTSQPRPSDRNQHACTVDVLPRPKVGMSHPSCDIRAPTRAVGAVSCCGVVVRKSEACERGVKKALQSTKAPKRERERKSLALEVYFF